MLVDGQFLSGCGRAVVKKEVTLRASFQRTKKGSVFSTLPLPTQLN
jgi:hypothetical protein